MDLKYFFSTFHIQLCGKVGKTPQELRGKLEKNATKKQDLSWKKTQIFLLNPVLQLFPLNSAGILYFLTKNCGLSNFSP